MESNIALREREREENRVLNRSSVVIHSPHVQQCRWYFRPAWRIPSRASKARPHLGQIICTADLFCCFFSLWFLDCVCVCRIRLITYRVIEMREKNWHRRNDCGEKKQQKGSEIATNQRKTSAAVEENRDSFFFNSFLITCSFRANKQARAMVVNRSEHSCAPFSCAWRASLFSGICRSHFFSFPLLDASIDIRRWRRRRRGNHFTLIAFCNEDEAESREHDTHVFTSRHAWNARSKKNENWFDQCTMMTKIGKPKTGIRNECDMYADGGERQF